MSGKFCRAAAALLAVSSVAPAAEPNTPAVPLQVLALTGCWEGRGEVMDKPVTIIIVAKPIVQNAMLALDVESRAVSDPRDRYSAHLILGGAGGQPKGAADRIVGFWADSFGGAFAASGRGETRSDGFDIIYRYPDDAFVNRWRRSGSRLMWRITARDGAGAEKPFAVYSLNKTACRISPVER